MVNYKVAVRDGCLSVALVASFLIPLLLVELAPAAEGPIMIVTDPFSEQNALQIIVAAEGKIVGSGRWPWIAIGVSDDPGFQTKLKSAGALFLLPPLAKACPRDTAL